MMETVSNILKNTYLSFVLITKCDPFTFYLIYRSINVPFLISSPTHDNPIRLLNRLFALLFFFSSLFLFLRKSHCPVFPNVLTITLKEKISFSFLHRFFTTSSSYFLSVPTKEKKMDVNQKREW